WIHNQNQPGIPSPITIDSSQPGNALSSSATRPRARPHELTSQNQRAIARDGSLKIGRMDTRVVLLRGGCGFREGDDRLEAVAAGIASPQVTHAVFA
ncbi:MAG: hypothetical protein K2Y71_28940, partial [Xanthobacteraceae bacterium]|nr:hypothetical protein [Xanthobacteraceae bacterium]